MEVLEWGGVRTMLFLEPPTPEFLTGNFPDVEAVGMAGISRQLHSVRDGCHPAEDFRGTGDLGSSADPLQGLFDL